MRSPSGTAQENMLAQSFAVQMAHENAEERGPLGHISIHCHAPPRLQGALVKKPYPRENRPTSALSYWSEAAQVVCGPPQLSSPSDFRSGGPASLIRTSASVLPP